MNKKGFTLVEIIVTLGLLAVVLVFMMNALIKLRTQEENATVDKNLLIHQSIISKNINKDVLDHDGILSFDSCASKKCTINLKDGSTRTLTISSDSKTLTYKNETTNIFIRTLDNDFEFKNITGSLKALTNGNLAKLVIAFDNTTILESTTDSTQSTIYYEGYSVGNAPKYNVEVYSYLQN